MYNLDGPPVGTGMGAIPDWLKSVAGAVIRGTRVTFGGQSFDLGNPADVALLRSTVTGGVKVSRTPAPAPSPVDHLNDAVSNFPGGWLGVGGALFGVWLLIRSMNRRG